MTITPEKLDDLEAKAKQRPPRDGNYPRELYDAIVRPIEVMPDVTLHLVSVYRAALAWRAQITTLSLAVGLPRQVWAELCRLDSEMSAKLRGISTDPPEDT